MHGCELSPSASAFSSMLSAFIGSIFNGLFSGYFIAFCTGWISWLAFIRILAAGAYELYLTIKAGTNVNASDDMEYRSIGLNMLDESGNSSNNRTTDIEASGGEYQPAHPLPQIDPARAHATSVYATPGLQKMPVGSTSLRKAFFKKPARDVTTFGWLGWTWSAIYTPVSQSIWVSVNSTSSRGPANLVRALAITVSTLGLTFDYKRRYAASIGRKWGPWAFVTFNAWNSTACLLLGVEATYLLIRGAVESSLPLPFLIIYPIFCVIWAWVSWNWLPPIDGARPGWNIFVDVLMGAFAGLFCAAPAFALWQSEQFNTLVSSDFGHEPSNGMDLGDFLRCEGASFWEKFAAVMP